MNWIVGSECPPPRNEYHTTNGPILIAEYENREPTKSDTRPQRNRQQHIDTELNSRLQRQDDLIQNLAKTQAHQAQQISYIKTTVDDVQTEVKTQANTTSRMFEQIMEKLSGLTCKEPQPTKRSAEPGGSPAWQRHKQG